MRRCVMCGADLSHLRRDALACSPECRRERSRLLRLLAGEPDSGYETVLSYLERRRRRAPQARRGALIAPSTPDRMVGHKAARRGGGTPPTGLDTEEVTSMPYRNLMQGGRS
jgi:hypothetical protein